MFGPIRLRTLASRPEIREGFEQFLKPELYRVMETHARVARAGFRALIYVQPSEETDPEEVEELKKLINFAKEAEREAQSRQGLATPLVLDLPEAKLPDWDDDIVPFLKQQRAAEHVFEVAREVYDRLSDPEGELTFAGFADTLEDALSGL